MESTPAQTGIRHLPDEILRLILSYVSSTFLLRNCRLVSSMWWEHSTEICHKVREIRLKWVPTTIISQQGKVPWSFYIFKKDVKISDELRNFITANGTHLRKLILESNYSTRSVEMEKFAEEVLNFTPNLRFLTINGKFSWIESSIMRVYNPLLHLNYLQILGDSLESQSHIDWFLQLFGKSPLREISLSISQGYGDTVLDMEPVVRKLGKVPTISLYLGLSPNSSLPQFLGPFLDCPPKLKKFAFSIGAALSKEYSAASDQGYLSMATLLKNSADTIENFGIGGSGGTVPFGCSPFQFPTCPKLKEFKLAFPGNQNDFLTTMMSELSTFEVPNLESIKISDMIFPPPSTLTTLFQRDLVFETVKQLKVDSSHIFRDHWEKIFPNLRKLKTQTFWVDSQLCKIYSLQHLEDLEIKVYATEENAQNASQLLSGIPTTEKIEGKSNEEINKLRQTHQLPSILQLTKLKTFKIEFRGNAGELNDSVAWTFLQFPPMNKITLINVNMPEEAKVKVMGYQTCFEILEQDIINW